MCEDQIVIGPRQKSTEELEAYYKSVAAKTFWPVDLQKKPMNGVQFMTAIGTLADEVVFLQNHLDWGFIDQEDYTEYAARVAERLLAVVKEYTTANVDIDTL